jgi:coenzyme Q-binding protein COQ10
VEAGVANKIMIEVERQHLPYSPAQLFELVADVAKYPEFLPWVIDVQLVRRDDNHKLLVRMTIASGPLHRTFTTLGILHPPDWIEISSHDPLFARFHQRWTFTSTSNRSTAVEYFVDIQLRSRLLQILVEASFVRSAAATMAAFKRRARELYGDATDGALI